MKYLVFGTGIGFGDMLICMTAMKKYHELGYRIVLPVEEQWESAISECPFIHKILPLTIRSRFSTKEMWDGGENIEKYMANVINEYLHWQDGKSYCVRSFHFLPLWMSLVNKLDVEYIPSVKTGYDALHCRSYTSQADTGLKPTYPCPPEVWFKRIPMCLPKGFKIGISFGSPDSTRRFSPQKMQEILRSLDTLDSTTLIIGGVKDEEYCLIGKGNWHCIDRKMKMPINHCLSLIEQLDVFISPDSGLVHACYPMKAHIITFQSRIFAEYVWHSRENMDILRASNDRLYCTKRCSAKRMEALMTKSELYDRTRGMRPERVKEIRSQLKLADPLDCFERFSVACLEMINIQGIKSIVQKVKDKHGNQ